MKYVERESKNLEFNSELPSFSKLIKTCIAFANGIGGDIVIGVEDQSQEIELPKDNDLWAKNLDKQPEAHLQGLYP